ncbi:unnamed protein product, partial [Cuscuta epithymum]
MSERVWDSGGDAAKISGSPRHQSSHYRVHHRANYGNRVISGQHIRPTPKPFRLSSNHDSRSIRPYGRYVQLRETDIDIIVNKILASLAGRGTLEGVTLADLP